MKYVKFADFEFCIMKKYQNVLTLFFIDAR